MYEWYIFKILYQSILIFNIKVAGLTFWKLIKTDKILMLVDGI